MPFSEGLEPSRIPIHQRHRNRLGSEPNTSCKTPPEMFKTIFGLGGRGGFAGHEELAHGGVSVLAQDVRRRKGRLQEPVDGAGQALRIGFRAVVVNLHGLTWSSSSAPSADRVSLLFIISRA